MEIAKKYGMIQPGESSTKAVRAVFFVDPAGIIRAIIYYPLSLGRNFDELKRALIAMQTACLLYTSDAADERSSVDLGGRRIIKKKKSSKHTYSADLQTKRHNDREYTI